MRYGLAEEQEALRDAVAGFLEQHCTIADTRALMDSELGYDPKVWERACAELGLAGIAVPEQYGGAGSTLVSSGVVLRELGRTLCTFPYLSSVVLAGTAVGELSTPQYRAELLPGIASGQTIATLAVREPVPGSFTVVQQQENSPEPFRLSGVKSAVLDAQLADVLLVTAPAGTGLGLYAVDRGAAGLTYEREVTLDLTRRQYTVTFADTPARRVSDSDITAGLARVLDIGLAALAAEAVGGAERVLAMAVEYAGLREQFGRPIGSFQAIKHLCAEMLVTAEGAFTTAFYALWAADARPEDLAFSARAAGSYCAEAYGSLAATNIQIHGGIGFTWEHPAHLYLRRARTSETLFGSPEQLRAQILLVALE